MKNNLFPIYPNNFQYPMQQTSIAYNPLFQQGYNYAMQQFYNNMNYRMPAGLYGLGDLTDEQVMDIVKKHFDGLSLEKKASIGYSAIQGDFTPISNEVRVLMTDICTAGAKDKIIELVKNNIFLIVIGVLGFMAGSYFIINSFTKKSKKKK